MARRRLGWEISVLLAAKAILLGALYFTFFYPAHQVVADAPATSARVLGESGD